MYFTYMQHNLIKGALWMLSYTVLSTINDSVTKLLTTDLASAQIVFFRFLFGALSLIAVLIYKKEKIRTLFLKQHIIRAALLSFGMLCYTSSLHSLPLAVNIVGCFTIPIIVSILASLFLKEPLKQNIFNTILSFVGVLIVFAPYLAFTHVIVLSILMLGIFAFASLDIMNKVLLIKNESTILIMFYTALFASFFSLPQALYTWEAISNQALLYTACLGIGGNLVFYCLLKSFSSAPITYMQPFKYMELPLSVLAGFFIFNEQIYYSFFIGCSLIIFSTIHATYKYVKIRNC